MSQQHKPDKDRFVVVSKLYCYFIRNKNNIVSISVNAEGIVLFC